MCYGICKYERYPSGECRGDWGKPGAACAEGYVDEDEWEPDPEDLIPPERIVDWPI